MQKKLFVRPVNGTLHYPATLSGCNLALKCIILLILTQFINIQSFGQYFSVTNTSGTVSVGGVNVTVTGTGSVTTYPCSPGGPYWTGSGSSGTYTWTFSSPVLSIKMHIDAQDPGDNCSFKINGSSYSINS